MKIKKLKKENVYLPANEKQPELFLYLREHTPVAFLELPLFHFRELSAHGRAEGRRAVSDRVLSVSGDAAGSAASALKARPPSRACKARAASARKGAGATCATRRSALVGRSSIRGATRSARRAAASG